LKFSFIVPALNEEKIILNLLKQISDVKLKEKYDYEIILSDGGSRDATVSLSAPFADKIVLNECNSKQNIAQGRNKGAEAAQGEYLIFINADVTLSNPEAFFQTLEKEFLNSGIPALTCPVRINPDEETPADKLFLIFCNKFFFFLNLIGLGMGRGECHIVKNDLFKSIKGNDVNLAAGEDFDLFRRIRKRSKVFFSKNTLVYESPRRYREKGRLKILFYWFMNSISIILLKKSFSKTWEPVR